MRYGDSAMKSGPSSPYDRPDSPWSRQNASKSAHMSPCVRRTSSRKAGQPVRSATGYPDENGAIAGSFISIGLHETMRTHGRPLAAIAGNATTLSSTMTSGATSSKISASRGLTYFAPSMSACQVGAMNSPSCSTVGLRKTGAVSRMKSIQNWPGTSGSAGGGPSRMSRSSNPLASSVPANDSSTTNTTRWPCARSTCPMPTQLFVGP